MRGNIPPETIRPRTWQQQPGDRLILVPDATKWMSDAAEFERELGDGQREFIYNIPACATPLYERHEEGPAGIPLRVAWHPVFWLPTKLARPLPEESDAEWGYRVATAFIEHGIYTPDDGSWVDIPAWLGLDLDHPIDRAHIQNWLAGNPVPALDSIDWETINGLYPATPETDHVGIQDSIINTDLYTQAQWTLTTQSLFDTVAAALDGLETAAAAAKAPEVFDLLAPTVLMTLADVPEIFDGWGTIWESVEPISAALRGPGADTVELLGDLTSQIVAIHDTYAPALTEVLASEAEDEDRRGASMALETL